MRATTLIFAIAVVCLGCVIEKEVSDDDDRRPPRHPTPQREPDDTYYDRYGCVVTDASVRDGGDTEDAGPEGDAGTPRCYPLNVQRRRAEIYQATPVSRCIDAGAFPLSVTYEDKNTETLSLKYEIVSGEVNLDQLDAQTFSSRATEELGVSGLIWSGAKGMWYRQRSRFVAEWNVVTYDDDNRRLFGRVRGHAYTWSVSLSVGPSCPLPSHLPPAECYVLPCDHGVEE